MLWNPKLQGNKQLHLCKPTCKIDLSWWLTLMGGTGDQPSLLHGVLNWSFQSTCQNLEPNGILILIPTINEYIHRMIMPYLLTLQ